MPKALTQGLGVLNRLEVRLEDQSSKECGRRSFHPNKQLILVNVIARNIGRDGKKNEKDPLGQIMLVVILLLQNDLRQGNLSSALLPDTVPMASTALGSAAKLILHLHGGAGPQQQHDHLNVAFICCQVQRRLASVRRSRRANESCWKTRNQGKVRIQKITVRCKHCNLTKKLKGCDYHVLCPVSI